MLPTTYQSSVFISIALLFLIDQLLKKMLLVISKEFWNFSHLQKVAAEFCAGQFSLPTHLL